jgi:hypothetical protein
MTLVRWILVIALLLTPAAISAYKARFLMLVDCGSLRGDGMLHLKDRRTGATFRIGVSCNRLVPYRVEFL